MFSITNFLINYIPNNNLGKTIIGIEFIFFASFFKSYCFHQSIFKGSPLSAILWINLVSTLVPLPKLLTASNPFENAPISILRGLNSFSNFYLYWNLASKYLNKEEVIVSETICEAFIACQALYQSSNLPRQLNLLVVALYHALKCLIIYKDKERILASGKPSEPKDRRGVFN